MLARVATWEGGDAEGLRAAVSEMQGRVDNGPPSGLKTKGLTMLVDPDGGKALMIGLFASAEDLADSEATLAGMNPPPGLGSRTSVTVYEVGVEVRM